MDNGQEKKSPFNILKVMKRKFPAFILFVHICIAKYVFTCDISYTSSLNSSEVTKVISYDSEYENTTLFWTYLVVMSIICFTWEFLYIYFRYRRKHRPFKNAKVIAYAIFTAVVSMVAFLSTVFYLDDNNVFDCFMEYNEFLANITFFISYAILCVVSIIEHYCLANI